MMFRVVSLLNLMPIVLIVFQCVINGGYTETIIPLEFVQRWARQFGEDLYSLTKTVTAVEKIKKKYRMYNVRVRRLEGDKVVAEMAANMEKMFQRKVKAAQKSKTIKDTIFGAKLPGSTTQRVVEKAEDINSQVPYNDVIKLDYYNSKKLITDTDVQMMANSTLDAMMSDHRFLHLLPSEQFNDIPINSSISTVHVPTNVFDKSIKVLNAVNWSDALDSVFAANSIEDPTLTWQYFGSSTGFLRVYPGLKWPRNNKRTPKQTKINVDMFDCRIRGWYIQAASFPKDMIILMDSSGSMTGQRMSIAKKTVGKILDTLSDDDFFNIIQFNDQPLYVDECLNQTLVQATSQNRQRLKEMIDTTKTENIANFEKALIEAFELFQKLNNSKKQAGCNRVIMIITDGAPENYEWVFSKYNWLPNAQVRVFSYLIGREVADSKQVRWMACANYGYFTHISTLADVQENVQLYVKVLSRPMVDLEKRHSTWTPVYRDYFSTLEDAPKGLGLMTSYAVPVFGKVHEANEDIGLVGVVGTDVPVTELTKLTPQYKLGVNGYSFAITNNGYLLFHPEFKLQASPSLMIENKIDFTSVDLREVERSKKAKNVRVAMIDRETGSKRMRVRVPFDNTKRVLEREHYYYYTRIKETPFSLGIVIPKGYGEFFLNETLGIRYYDPVILKGDYVEVAPWPYCNYKKLPETSCLSSLSPYLDMGRHGETAFYDSCMVHMVESLLYDANVSYAFQKFWNGASRVKQMNLNGIELIFFGSRAGLTRWKQVAANLTDRDFMRDNTKSVENQYYQLAAHAGDGNIFINMPLGTSGEDQLSEAMAQSVGAYAGDVDADMMFPGGLDMDEASMMEEETEDRPHDLTQSQALSAAPEHSIMSDRSEEMMRAEEEEQQRMYLQPPMHQELANNTMLTISMPVFVGRKNRTIAGVVGYQMKYLSFQEKFYSHVYKCPFKNCDRQLSCSNGSFKCYLVDGNGYMVVSRSSEEIGKFFGEFEPAIMQDLIDRNFYKSYSIILHQEICEDDSDQENNSANILLDPLRRFLYFMFSGFMQVLIFLLNCVWMVWANSIYGLDKGNFEDYYNLQAGSFNEAEKNIWYMLSCYYKKCPKNDAVEFERRKCVENRTLYMVNPRSVAMEAYISNCTDCVESKQLCQQDIDNVTRCYSECSRTCQKHYSIDRVLNTNLLLLVTSDNCRCEKEPMTMPVQEVKTSEEKECSKLQEGIHRQPSADCPSYLQLENSTYCSAHCRHLSKILLFLTITIRVFILTGA